jgi:ubiquinone/menaquinone biosynthesis C-methylase UbiE
MIARACSKAARSALEVDFQIAAAQALPFSEATFDVVLSTTMLHCLPEDARRRSIHEMGRVLKPGGRLLIVDFGGPAETRRSFIAHLRLHRHFDVREVLRRCTLQASSALSVERWTSAICNLFSHESCRLQAAIDSPGRKAAFGSRSQHSKWEEYPTLDMEHPA